MKNLRRRIQEKNREAMHEHGYQGLRADLVIKELGLTKGAYYHYFSGKQELGYSILDELIAPKYLGHWNVLNSYFGHPIEGIVERLKALRTDLKDEDFQRGSQLNNLIQEMAQLDSGFQQRLKRIVEGMSLTISGAIERGQKSRLVVPDADPEIISLFVLSSLFGAFSLAKACQNRKPFDLAIEHLIGHLRFFKGSGR